MRARDVVAKIALMLAACASTVSTGCGATGALRAAENGDRAGLKREIAAREKAGSLSNDDAAKLAKEVASREIATAPNDQAMARVREVRACAVDLDSALASRMKTHDAAGAEAALARIESRQLSEGDLRGSITDSDDAWRAAGARGLTREEDRASRARMIVDPAPAVRRAAMHAAIAAKDGSELDAIGEAARLDPDPLVRSEAVRALAQLGGAAAVARLRDLWTNADDPIREDIAIAWSSAAIRSAGGRDELRLLLAAGHGPPAIDGAGAALRSDVRDKEIDASAAALLARTIQSGSTRNRLHAIAIAPIAEGIVVALRAASKDDDSAIRVGSLARLTESAPDTKASIAALEAIAGQPGGSATSSRAKLALASAGDTRIQAWIESDLVASSIEVRLSAASALAALGRPGRAAPLLADDDASVRTRAACTILLGARFRH